MTRSPFYVRPAANGTFNTLLDDFFAPFPSIRSERSVQPGRPAVPVNIRENESAYQLEVVAPGFVKEDFTLRLEEKLLTITAEKKSEESAKTEKTLRREYNFSSFKRSFTLDESIDASGITAQYVNGVLALNLPKRAEVKPSVKQIEIK